MHRSGWIADKEILRALEACEQEIVDLRRRNELLYVENRAFNRLLGALESHRPESKCVGESENVVWKIQRTREELKNAIEKEAYAEKLEQEKKLADKLLAARGTPIKVEVNGRMLPEDFTKEIRDCGPGVQS